tara:strand:- start:2946 stop:5072 length:2127 start_codon:yes stop_codon:yes gene_type:complete
MMREPYDSFDYEQPADYLPALKEGYQQINQGFEDAEAFARVNDRQRLANAEIMGRAIDNAAKFSKSMAGHLKKKRKERDEEYSREAFGLSMKVPLSWQGYQAYKNDSENLRKDHTFNQYAAFQANEAGDTDLAEEFSGLSGWQSVVLKKVVGRTWAANYKSDFYGKDGIHAKDKNGKNKYFLETQNDDGSKRLVTWSEANAAERNLLIDQYNTKHGFDVVKDFNKEFAKDTFWKSYEKAISGITEAENLKASGQFWEEKNALWDSQLIAAGQTNNFASEFHQVVEEAYAVGHAKGLTASEVRTQLKTKAMNLVLTGKLKPGEISLDDYTYTHNDGQTKNLKDFTEFTTWNEDVIAIQDKQRQLEKSKEKSAMNAFSKNLYAKVEETGQKLSEKDTAAIHAEFRKQFPNVPFAQWPENVKDLMSQEDDLDDNYKATLQYKYDNSIPILKKDWINIYNAEDREKWKKIANSSAGQGVETAKKRDRDVNSVVGGFLSELKGTKEEKSLEFNTLHDRSTAFYNNKYAELIGGWDPDDMSGLHGEIISQLKLKIPTMDLNLAGPEDTTTYKRRIVAAKEFIAETERDPNLTHTDRLSNNLLPNSEIHMKQLEDGFAKNPERSSIPHYYYAVAEPLKGMTAWHVANLQYKLKTGKELPKPLNIKEFEKLSPAAQQVLSSHPTGNSSTQVEIIEGNLNPNEEQLLTPGLFMGATA